MPRKSRDLRLSQTKSLIEAYAEAGIGHADRSFRFMNDMLIRLERGKGLSTGQRKYLDSLIDQGVPKLKNEERVNEILAAAKVDGMQQSASTLSDFAFKVGKGWSLSEKQEKFLASLLSKAEKLKKEGRFRPSGELLEDLMAASSICAVKNGWYWQHRPGTAKAYDKVSRWLDWHRRNKVRNDLLEAGIDEDTVNAGNIAGEEPIIDQWACDKLLKALKNPLSELKNPKHPAGSMVWKVMYNAPKSCALVTGPPVVQKGKIVYPCLVSGEDVMVPTEDLKKRRG
tara:strand:+ start:17481 stop:18332 length:852 start_codon:yes stop_codon:yes gene_type:complete